MLLVDLAPGDVSDALREYLPFTMPDCVAVALSIPDWLSVVPDRNAGGAVSIQFDFLPDQKPASDQLHPLTDVA